VLTAGKMRRPWRRTQVVKGEVCKTFMRGFESPRRLTRRCALPRDLRLRRTGARLGQRASTARLIPRECFAPAAAGSSLRDARETPAAASLTASSPYLGRLVFRL